MENHIGQNIRRIADERKLSATQIAYKWVKSPGKSHTAAAVWNLFKNKNPTAFVILDMARILDANLYDIFGMDEKTGRAMKSSDTLQEISIELIETFRAQLQAKDKQIEFLQELLKKYQP